MFLTVGDTAESVSSRKLEAPLLPKVVGWKISCVLSFNRGRADLQLGGEWAGDDGGYTGGAITSRGIMAERARSCGPASWSAGSDGGGVGGASKVCERASMVVASTKQRLRPVSWHAGGTEQRKRRAEGERADAGRVFLMLTSMRLVAQATQH